MYYFAYGSNMSLDHMRRICGWHAKFLGRAFLDNFELGVDLRGYANVRSKAGEKVLGILYEIDQEGLGLLDEFEGYPTIFGRQEVLVFDENKVKYSAQVYIEPMDQFNGKSIREEYFRRVIAAASENHLSEAWVKKLEDIVAKSDKI